MKPQKILLILIVLTVMLTLQGCDSAVQEIIMSNSYNNGTIGAHQKVFSAEDDIYNLVKLVETQQGTKIEVKWYFGKDEIKAEEKATTQPRKDNLLFVLEKDKKAKSGDYKYELYYNGKHITTKQFKVE